MYLVDTSVWIQVFRKSVNFNISKVIPFDDIVTALPILQEVLQGCRDERAYRIAYESMVSLPMVDSPMPQERVIEAILLYRTARKTGLTVRSSIDCLIAASAMRHNLTVLHIDRDFSVLAKVSSLKERVLP